MCSHKSSLLPKDQKRLVSFRMDAASPGVCQEAWSHPRDLPAFPAYGLLMASVGPASGSPTGSAPGRQRSRRQAPCAAGPSRCLAQAGCSGHAWEVRGMGAITPLAHTQRSPEAACPGPPGVFMVCSSYTTFSALPRLEPLPPLTVLQSVPTNLTRGRA